MPASPGSSKVMYEVKKMERETAWERGYVGTFLQKLANFQ